MNLRANYETHEKSYQQLKKDGATGWGGETFDARIRAWQESIAKLRACPEFPLPPSKLLELGSGAGDLSLHLAQLGYEVHGVEISATAVAWAREKCESANLSVRFYAGSVCDLSRFPDASLHGVVDGNCLHCIIGEDRGYLLSEVYRVLVPQGVFYVSTMIGDPKQDLSPVKFDPTSRCQIKDGNAYRYMGQKEDVLNELIEQDFEILTTEVTDNAWWQHLHCLARKKLT